MRELAQIILVCSKQALLNANDILDQKLLQNGHFQPAYTQGSIAKCIQEIITINKLTLTDRDVKLSVDFDQIASEYPCLYFD